MIHLRYRSPAQKSATLAAVTVIVVMVAMAVVNGRAEGQSQQRRQTRSRCMSWANPEYTDTLAAREVSMLAQRLIAEAETAAELVRSTMEAWEGEFHSFYTSAREVASYAVLFDPAEPAYRLQLAEVSFTAARRGEGRFDVDETRAALVYAECAIVLAEASGATRVASRASSLSSAIGAALRLEEQIRSRRVP